MNRTANPLRGETAFEVNGTAVLIRPSFEALVAVEEEIGSLFSLVERASAGALTIVEITALLWNCMPEDGRPGKDTVGESILSIGLV
ncbi:MAG: GTA-gp10 family protein, partial [Pseudomonadota bacterium]